MSAPMLRTAAEVFAADCDHGTDPVRCPACRLTEDEITRMAVLHRPHLLPGSTQAAPRAA